MSDPYGYDGSSVNPDAFKERAASGQAGAGPSGDMPELHPFWDDVLKRRHKQLSKAEQELKYAAERIRNQKTEINRLQELHKRSSVEIERLKAFPLSAPASQPSLYTQIQDLLLKVGDLPEAEIVEIRDYLESVAESLTVALDPACTALLAMACDEVSKWPKAEALSAPKAPAGLDLATPECHPRCGDPYLGNSHHPDCERGAWEDAHACQKCNRTIGGEIYLCMECTHPFHRACLFEHCGKADKTNEAYLDALKGAAK